MKVFYTSRNNPASLKHFTLVVLGNNSLNSSQCSIDAKPPAEHPERRAWNMDKHIKRGIKMVNWATLHHKHNLISVAHSLWHQIFHSSWPDALSPEIQFLGLWSNNRIIKFSAKGLRQLIQIHSPIPNPSSMGDTISNVNNMD